MRTITRHSTVRASFKHEPLNQFKKSIRLLQVSWALTIDNLVQCTIVHSTINQEPYACLSYTWGPPTPSRHILINGKAHIVGKNLFDFLDYYRLTKSPPSQFLWIDAICIAQDDIRERNHQVMQMGEIFSTAQLVYIWLGKNSVAAYCIHRHRTSDCSMHGNDFGRVLRESFDDDGNDDFIQWLYYNEYWTGAWVTQELILARRLVMFLDEEVLPLAELLEMLPDTWFASSLKESPFGRHLSILSGADVVSGSRLIDLLSRFHNKKCGIIQDKVFCLNSLCSAPSQLVIDYDKPLADLAFDILSNTPDIRPCEVIVVLLSLDLIPHPESNTSRRWTTDLGLEVTIPNDGPAYSLGHAHYSGYYPSSAPMHCQAIADLFDPPLVLHPRLLQLTRLNDITMWQDIHWSRFTIPLTSLASLSSDLRSCRQSARGCNSNANLRRGPKTTSKWKEAHTRQIPQFGPGHRFNWKAWQTWSDRTGSLYTSFELKTKEQKALRT